jgi:hypothetical protein
VKDSREEPRRTGAPQGLLSSFDQHRTAGIDDLASEQALRPLYEVNQQCIELLVSAAWSERPTLPLVRQFQGSFRNLSAQARARAAHKGFLLVDMEFMNGSWWECAKKHPSRIVSPSRTPYFPRNSAIQLARGALVVVQHSILTNATEACLLGVHPSVTEIIGELSMTDVERIVERRFRYIQPRWEDRPAIWQRLIQAACSPDIRLTREFNLRGLQLLAGELL